MVYLCRGGLLLYRGDYDKERGTIIIEEDYYLRGDYYNEWGSITADRTITIERDY